MNWRLSRRRKFPWPNGLFYKALFSNKMSNLDFPVVAKKQFGISTVEYVNQFFKDKAEDHKYPSELLQRCRDHGVKKPPRVGFSLQRGEKLR